MGTESKKVAGICRALQAYHIFSLRSPDKFENVQDILAASIVVIVVVVVVVASLTCALKSHSRFLPAAINEVDGLRHWNDNSPPLG
jgi:hypothetical protein